MTDGYLKHQHYFNGMADSWTERMPARMELHDYLAEFGVCASATILDLGAGTGRLVKYLTRLTGNPDQVVALDIADQMLRLGCYEQLGMGERRVCADVCSLPFGCNSFTKVVALALYPHLHDPDCALRELWRVLTPGGRVLILHTSGSDRLNAFHQTLNPPVCDDVLPHASQVAKQLQRHRFFVQKQLDQPDLYWIEAEKSL